LTPLPPKTVDAKIGSVNVKIELPRILLLKKNILFKLIFK